MKHRQWSGYRPDRNNAVSFFIIQGKVGSLPGRMPKGDLSDSGLSVSGSGRFCGVRGFLSASVGGSIKGPFCPHAESELHSTSRKETAVMPLRKRVICIFNPVARNRNFSGRKSLTRHIDKTEMPVSEWSGNRHCCLNTARKKVSLRKFHLLRCYFRFRAFCRDLSGPHRHW